MGVQTNVDALEMFSIGALTNIDPLETFHISAEIHFCVLKTRSMCALTNGLPLREIRTVLL